MTEHTEARAWATALAAGKPAPVGDYHTDEEWRTAAQCGLDGDWSDFEHMLEVEEQWLAYGDYCDRFPVRGYRGSTEYYPPLGFDDWRQEYVR